jgi:signal transduction histidine kinase
MIALCRGLRHCLLILVSLATALPPVAHAAASNDVSAVQRMIDQARAELIVGPENAILIAENSSRLAQQTLAPQARDSLMSEADAVISRGLISLSRIDEAAAVVKRGFERAKAGQIAPKVIGELTLSSARIYQNRGDVQRALAAFQRAYRIFRFAGEKRSQAVVLQSIAKLYVDGGDGESAIKYYAQSDDEYAGDPVLELSSRNNRGMAYLLLSQPKEAEIQFQQALVVAKKIGSAKYAPRILSNIAQAQIAQGRLNDASIIVDRAFSALQGGDSTAEAWRLWQRRAQIALARKDLKPATTAIERALDGVDPKSSDANYRETHAAAYEIYRASGRVNDSLVHLEAVWRLDQATAKLTATNSAALMAARFDSANQKTRIAQLKANELELQRNFLIAVIAGGALVLLLLSVGLILITRSRNRERAAKLLLAQTNRDLEKAIAAKMEFLATTSHEIRTPLNGILGMTQVMLADRKMDATLRDRIGIVHDAGETMRTLVDDILDVAKMETGKLAVGSGTVDLKTTLRHVAQVWRLQAEAAGVELALRLDDCPEAIEGDAGRIRQIVFNLLSNAMKFTEKGRVELAVDTETTGRIRISVRDSGIGIERKWHESIFELFQQVDGGTTRKYGGTGLGLAICRNLARAMGGDITVESEPGFGSTFTLDLPLIEPAVLSLRPHSDERPSTVLVIEHNPLTRGMMRAILSERFEAVKFVDGVAEACAFLALDEADWIVADAASIDDFEPLFAATELPVALIVSEDFVGDVASRAVALLRKPLTKSALLQIFGRDTSPVAVAA